MSPNHLPSSISDKIEDLCQQGCQHVNTVIQKLELKLPVEGLQAFSEDERAQILAALSDIMAVYRDKDDK